MTNSIQASISLIPAFILGMLHGVAFFWTMWFTLQRGVISPHPVRWLLGGLLFRITITVTGFYCLATENWLTILICLFGFVIARELVRRLVVFRRVHSPNLLNTELK